MRRVNERYVRNNKQTNKKQTKANIILHANVLRIIKKTENTC